MPFRIGTLQLTGGSLRPGGIGNRRGTPGRALTVKCQLSADGSGEYAVCPGLVEGGQLEAAQSFGVCGSPFRWSLAVIEIDLALQRPIPLRHDARASLVSALRSAVQCDCTFGLGDLDGPAPAACSSPVVRAALCKTRALSSIVCIALVLAGSEVAISEAEYFANMFCICFTFLISWA